MSLKIVIPSHKRWDRVLSKRLVIDPIICVAESQADLYREFNPGYEIVTHPDDIVGLIPKRNWMAKYFGDLFMLDDDVYSFNRVYVEAGERQPIKSRRKITKRIFELHELAEMLDIHLFGFSNCVSPTMYNDGRFLSLQKMVTGCAYGVRYNKNVWWNEKLKLKEDFWISCWMKLQERAILTDQRYSFHQKGTFASSGGLAEIRNQDEERRNILEMRRYFGEVIHLKSQGNNGHHKTRDKVKYNISATFPF